MAGNKGGIAVHLVFYNTMLCFVTAHLAAGQSNVDERNADYNEITEQTVFGRQRNIKISNHHYSFWFGDFNYRIDLPDEDVRNCLANHDVVPLLKHDQLTKARQTGAVFHNYQEAPIIFDPTYKYDMHSQVYDTSPKNRAPAWTDRILWRQQDGQQTSLLFYDRAELTLSDHRPVCAYFRIEVKKTDKDKERAVRKQIIASFRAANGADAGKDIISWDDVPAPAAAPAGQSAPATSSAAAAAAQPAVASLLDFDFDPRGTLASAESPVPAQAQASSSPVVAAAPVVPAKPSGASPSGTHKKLPPLPPSANGNSPPLTPSSTPSPAVARTGTAAAPSSSSTNQPNRALSRPTSMPPGPIPNSGPNSGPTNGPTDPLSRLSPTAMTRNSAPPNAIASIAVPAPAAVRLDSSNNDVFDPFGNFPFPTTTQPLQPQAQQPPPLQPQPLLPSRPATTTFQRPPTAASASAQPPAARVVSLPPQQTNSSNNPNTAPLSQHVQQLQTRADDFFDSLVSANNGSTATNGAPVPRLSAHPPTIPARPPPNQPKDPFDPFG